MDKKLKGLIVFLLKALLIYVLWSFVEVFLLQDGNFVEKTLTGSEAFLVSKLLTLFGYTNVAYEYLPPDASIVLMDGKKVVGISDSCNGLVLFVTFLGFIIAFPTKLKAKVRFSLIGICFIYIVNVIRIFLLGLIYIYFPQYLDFNHHYTFTFLVYMDIFLLWMLFVKKYGQSVFENE